MRKKIFATTDEEMQEFEEKYNLEDGGMSGTYPDHHWYYDDENEVDVYFKREEGEI